jgi:hypothetical protein
MLITGLMPVQAATRMEVRLSGSSETQLAAQLGELAGSLDICAHGRTQDDEVYLLVDCTSQELAAIRATGVPAEVTWADIRDKFRAVTGCDPDDGSFRDFGYFFNYWEMRDTILSLAARYPQIVRIDSTMRSFRSRPMYCLKVSDNPDSAENEPQVFINGAIHAREPLGTHTCIAFASVLCRDYGVDSLGTWLVNNREIYIVPVQNADGYIYNSDSGGSSSNWRKNRNNTSPRTGPGVDLNRNYGYRWGYDNNGSSPIPSNEVYRGPARFSEPEAEAFRAFQAAHRFRTEMDFHTYGRSNMYPWGYDAVTPPDEAVLVEMCDTLAVYNGYPSAQASGVNGVSFDWKFSDTLWNGTPKFVTYAFTSELGITDFWYGSNNPPYVDSEVARNVPNCYYLARVAGVWLQPSGVVVNDTLTGNASGKLDPGETANLWFKLKNRAVHPLDTALNVTATLASSDTLVAILTPSVTFPSLPRRSQADNRSEQFQVQASPEIAPGTVVDFRLAVTFADDGVTIRQPLDYRITIGAQSSVARSLTPDLRFLVPALRAFPNPTRGEVTFAVPGTQRAAPSIYALDGTLVRRLTSATWDCSDPHGLRLPPGIYFARSGGQVAPVMILP